jgi:hypothetical protein
MSMRSDPGASHRWLSRQAFPFRHIPERLKDGSDRFAERDRHLVHVWLVFVMAGIGLAIVGIGAFVKGEPRFGMIGLFGAAGTPLLVWLAMRDYITTTLGYDAVKARVVFVRSNMFGNTVYTEAPLSELSVVVRPVRMVYLERWSLTWSGFTVIAVVGEQEWLALCCVRTFEEVARTLHEWPSWIQERYIGEGPPLTAKGSRRIGFGYR